MFTRQHLLQWGFKKSSLEYQAALGKLDHITRLGPAGPRVYTGDQVMELARLLKVDLPQEVASVLSTDSSEGGSKCLP